MTGGSCLRWALLGGPLLVNAVLVVRRFYPSSSWTGVPLLDGLDP